MEQLRPRFLNTRVMLKVPGPGQKGVALTCQEQRPVNTSTPGSGLDRPLTPPGGEARGLAAEPPYLWVWSHSIGPPCLVNGILSTLNQSFVFFLNFTSTFPTRHPKKTK